MQDILRKTIKDTIRKSMPELKRIRTYLYENPEVGGEEAKASALLISTAKEHGFDVFADYYGIPYSFRAAYSGSKSGPVIGLTCEYDALPSIGHGCGHNVIAAASLGAAIALKSVIDETGGTVVLYGTPAEECYASKAQLTEEGGFDEADIMMTVHPNNINLSSDKTAALDAWQVEFFGKTSHAGACPEKGINALDAAVHFYTLIGFEKQYLKNTNVYGVFVHGGEKCSVIPDYASVKYLVRADSMKDIARIRAMFERCAEAAAKSTGATWKMWQNEPGSKDMITNEILSDIFNDIYEELSGEKMRHEKSSSSTDMGDVSHRRPAIHPWIGLSCPDCQIHSREFADMTLTPAGDRAIELGAFALALTGVKVLTSRKLMRAIEDEFQNNVIKRRA